MNSEMAYLSRLRTKRALCQAINIKCHLGQSAIPYEQGLPGFLLNKREMILIFFPSKLRKELKKGLLKSKTDEPPPRPPPHSTSSSLWETCNTRSAFP